LNSRVSEFPALTNEQGVIAVGHYDASQILPNIREQTCTLLCSGSATRHARLARNR
jgi:hypothetical protein